MAVPRVPRSKKGDTDPQEQPQPQPQSPAPRRVTALRLRPWDQGWAFRTLRRKPPLVSSLRVGRSLGPWGLSFLSGFNETGY